MPGSGEQPQCCGWAWWPWHRHIETPEEVIRRVLASERRWSVVPIDAPAFIAALEVENEKRMKAMG